MITCDHLIRSRSGKVCGARPRFYAVRGTERMLVCGRHANSLALVLPKWTITEIKEPK